MATRRGVLASVALAPLLAAGRGGQGAQVEAPGGTPPADGVPDLSGTAPLPLTGERLAAFEAAVAAMLAEAAIPGAAVAVVQGGAVAFLQGFGVRELGRPEPVSADTLLRIGSVTKSFSSLLAATLVDVGRVGWETPLADLLPAFAVADPALTPRLTLRDAFCACSGLPRRDLEFIFQAGTLSPEEMIAGMARLPLTAPFGETYQYNNQMVAAGGFAAGVANGGPPHDLGYAYAIALRERVLHPIGMARSTLDVSRVLGDCDHATPHAEDIGGALHPLPLLEDDLWLRPVAPAGALWSSAREMARYLQTELGRGVGPDGGRVVSAANLERTWQPSVLFPVAPDAPPRLAVSIGYGLGLGIGAYGGQRLINHSGATLGFSSLLTFLPEAGLGLIVLTNATGTAARFTTAVQSRLLELLFEQPATGDRFTAFLAGAERRRAEALADLGEIDPAAVTSYLGRYANGDLGELTLVLRGRTLVMTVGGFRTALRPPGHTAVETTAMRPVDAPFGEGGITTPPLTIGLQHGDDGRPQVMLTIEDDEGTDLVYRYERVGAGAAAEAVGG